MAETKEIKSLKQNISHQITLNNSVKSIYKIKNILSHLTLIKKLKLIIYNKQLQDKLGIDIELYKKTSGKYKIGEKNGLGKEYILNTEILLYEGRYKDGKRNGFGKEYNDKGSLIFKGLFLNGKKWNGYLKEYYDNGDIKYEGEIVEGIKNGKGKKYFDECLMLEIEYNRLKNYLQKEDGYLEDLKIKNEFENKYNNYKFIFDKEYINGEKWKGNIEIYNIFKELLFGYKYIKGERKEKEKNMIIVVN